MEEYNVQVVLGKKIKELRKAKKLSQEKLSLESGLHRNYICDVERGKRNISIVAIDKIAKALGISIKDLFD